MKILFVSPAIEEKSRGIGAIFRSLVESAKEDGHDVSLVLGYPEAKPFVRSKDMNDKLEHLYAQLYLRDGRDSHKELAKRKRLKVAIIEAMVSLSVFRSKSVDVNEEYLKGPKSLLNLSDHFIKAPFFYLILNFLPPFFGQTILNRIIRKNNIDLVVMSAPTRISNKKTPARVAHFVHDAIPLEIIEAPPSNNTPVRYAKQFDSTCNNSDLLFANSEDTASKVLEQNPDANVHVLYGTASSRKEDVGKGKIVAKKKFKKGNFLLFASNVEKRKNVTTLIKAYAAVHDELDMPLAIVGAPGYGYEEIEEEYNNLPKHIKKDVHFLGYVSEADKFDLYDNAFAFVLPSTYEGMGLMLIEAMQAEIPIIASDRGALKEAGGDAAYYVDDPYDIEALGGAMLELKNNPKLVKKLVQNGKKQREKFTFEKFAERFAGAVKSLNPNKKKRVRDSKDIAFTIPITRQLLLLNLNELIILGAIFLNSLNYWPTFAIPGFESASFEFAMLSGVLIILRALFVYRQKLIGRLLQSRVYMLLYAWLAFGVGWALAQTSSVKEIAFKGLYVFSIVLAAHIVAVMAREGKVSVEAILRGWVFIALLLVPIFLVQYALVSLGFDTFSKRAYQVGIFDFPRLHGFSFEPLFLANWLLAPTAYAFVKMRDNPIIPYLFSLLIFLALARGALIALTIALVGYVFTSRQGILYIRLLFRPMVYALITTVAIVGVVSQINGSTPLQGAFRYMDHLTLGVFNSGGANNVSFTEVEAGGETREIINTKEIDREGVVEASTVGRLDAIEVSLDMFEGNEAAGVGLFRLGEETMEELPEIYTDDSFVTNAQPVDVLVETGLIGVAILLVFAGLTLRRILQRNVLTVALVALTIQYFFFTNLFLLPFWLVLALLVVNDSKETQVMYE